MAEICIVCNEEIEDKEDYYRDEGVVMHFKVCRPEYFENPEKYGGKAKKGFTPREEDQNKEEKSKGMVLTDIDLPFGRVFWVTVQFFVAGLVLAIPIWLIIFAIVS